MEKAAEGTPQRLFFYNGGFWSQKGLRQVMVSAGYTLHVGVPAQTDAVVVWGHSPTALRGERMARAKGVPLIRVEDAFLRSIFPGRKGEAPLGVLIDDDAVHYDSSHPSALEQLLAHHPLDDSNLLQRARDGISRIQSLDLSKYNFHDPNVALPAPGYVLVIDQTKGDASIPYSGASAQSFQDMLGAAMEEHPGKTIVIKTHPEANLGLRQGHFGARDASALVTLLQDNVSPWGLLSGAIAVYTVSSQMGFEAILAGHRPRVFGQPFYAGWGLSADEVPVARRQRKLTKTQLFAAAMILAPVWFDPVRKCRCSFEDALHHLEARVRAFREDAPGYVATGMRLWKRRWLQKFYGQRRAIIFADPPGRAVDISGAKARPLLIWGHKPIAASKSVQHVEDGFLRSRGLGANLVPPLSLVKDDLGLYYDPSRESRLERMIQSPLPAGGKARAERLRAQIIAAGVSKYNLDASPLPPFAPGKCILVPGQVEDDASILLGTVQVCTNLELLQTVRAQNPQAVVVYKPHPDVEAGLRPGAIDPQLLQGLADHIAINAGPIALIQACDEVWTMTSLLGFEALLRDKPVVCLGAPFYAGWGLTKDLGSVPTRRRFAPDGHPLPRPELASLIYATLIAYPRYFDPITSAPCPPESILYRLTEGKLSPQPLPLRLLAKLQGRLSTYAHLWR
ncbi:MAG: hypothetical protein RIR95_2108 [Pseudomonadota bacterium]